MLFAQPVFQAVLSVAVVAAHADVGEGVDVGFALRVRALRGGQESRFAGRRGTGGVLRFSAGGGPGAGLGAFVCCLGAVVETVCPFAAFASEREEV